MISKEFCEEMLTVGLNVPEMIEHFMDREDMFMKYLKKFFESAGGVVGWNSPPPTRRRTTRTCCSRRIPSRDSPGISG